MKQTFVHIYQIESDTKRAIHIGDIVYKMSAIYAMPIGQIFDLTNESVHLKTFNNRTIKLIVKNLLYFKNKIQHLKF